MDNYIIIAPHLKLKTYKVFTLIIVLFNLIMFSMALSNMNAGSFPHYAALISCLALTAPMLQYIIFGNREAGLQNMLGGVFIAGIGWLFMQLYFSGIAMMCIALLGLIAIRPLRFLFNQQGLTMPGFPSRKISWSSIENVMIKDDMLTIDFKNNKLIQFSLKDAENENIDTAAFNKFATNCLASSTTNSSAT